MGERPVSFVNAVSTPIRPPGSATGFGANSDHERETSGAAPGGEQIAVSAAGGCGNDADACPRSEEDVIRVS